MIFMLVIDRNKQKLMVAITKKSNKAKGPQKLQIVLIYLLILAIS